MGKFATVVVDPPWYQGQINYDNARPDIQGRRFGMTNLPYQHMSLDEIRALPIPEVLMPDAFVFVWTTNKTLPDTFGVLDAWGLRYTVTMVWVKNGGIQTHVSPMFNAEYCLVGVRGKPKYTDLKAFMTANRWPRSEHSEKPEGFYDLLRRVTPSPRLDCFARRWIGGFTPWGDQAPTGENPLTDESQSVMF